eukprot:PhM_4_TR1314/c1_g1_i1/m.52899
MVFLGARTLSREREAVTGLQATAVDRESEGRARVQQGLQGRDGLERGQEATVREQCVEVRAVEILVCQCGACGELLQTTDTALLSFNVLRVVVAAFVRVAVVRARVFEAVLVTVVLPAPGNGRQNREGESVAVDTVTVDVVSGVVRHTLHVARLVARCHETMVREVHADVVSAVLNGESIRVEVRIVSGDCLGLASGDDVRQTARLARNTEVMEVAEVHTVDAELAGAARVGGVLNTTLICHGHNLVVRDTPVLDCEVLEFHWAMRVDTLRVLERISDLSALRRHRDAVEWAPRAAIRLVANVVVVAGVRHHVVELKADLDLVVGELGLSGVGRDIVLALVAAAAPLQNIPVATNGRLAVGLVESHAAGVQFVEGNVLK